MHAAANNQNPEVVMALLSAGADAKLKSNLGDTAFDYAEQNESLKDTEAYWELNNARYE